MNMINLYPHPSPLRAACPNMKFVLLHGIGSSPDSFSLLRQHSDQQLLVPDLRALYSNLLDDSVFMEQLIEDSANLILDEIKSDDEKFILCGHSAGGALCAILAHKLSDRIAGCALIDVSEELALNSSMPDIPASFASIEMAVQWSTHCGMLKNADSAMVSIPPLLSHCSETDQYEWICDVSKSERWRPLFHQHSSRFLSLKCPKLLMTSPHLIEKDTELLRGQMAGQFQTVTFLNCGHFVHEDLPAECADALKKFAERIDRVNRLNAQYSR